MTIQKKFIGDKRFYAKVLWIAVPIMVQNGITNFVSMLDNIMVGQIGTEQMSSVAIVNQLLFVYNLCIFGGVSGAGIFTAQFFGRKDDEGVRNTFRFKVWLGVILTVITTMLFLIAGEQFVGFYLTGNGDAGDINATLMYGMRYLRIMLFGLPAFMIGQIYASTLRECGETIVPMIAGVIAVFVNITFNWLLIFGMFGFPELGVEGAAIATVLSRYVEVLIVIAWTHINKRKNTYIVGVYSTMKIPVHLVKDIVKKGTPLLFNESLWAAGMAMMVQCYSVRGLSVVAALNISNTLNNVFNVVFIALGDSVAIIIGQLLGAGKMKEAKDTDTKLIAFSVTCCTIIAVVMFIVSPLFPGVYNTDAATKELAKYFIMVTAIFMPQNAFLHAAYFTLRSGGKTVITFLFDSVFIWCVNVPVAFALSRYTEWNVIFVYSFVQMADWIKCIIGFVLIKKGVWINNIVEKQGS